MPCYRCSHVPSYYSNSYHTERYYSTPYYSGNGAYLPYNGGTYGPYYSGAGYGYF